MQVKLYKVTCLHCYQPWKQMKNIWPKTEVGSLPTHVGNSRVNPAKAHNYSTAWVRVFSIALAYFLHLLLCSDLQPTALDSIIGDNWWEQSSVSITLQSNVTYGCVIKKTTTSECNISAHDLVYSLASRGLASYHLTITGCWKNYHMNLQPQIGQEGGTTSNNDSEPQQLLHPGAGYWISGSAGQSSSNRGRLGGLL